MPSSQSKAPELRPSAIGQSRVVLQIQGRQIPAREIVLPLPPSENALTQINYACVKAIVAGKGRRGPDRIKTRRYNQWIDNARRQLMKGKLPRIEGDVAVFITFVFGDRRLRDAQNYEKALFDGMTQSGCVWADDSQVAMHTTERAYAKGLPFALAYVVRAEDLATAGRPWFLLGPDDIAAVIGRVSNATAEPGA